MLTLASLFDGIGGWLIAAHRNGIKPVWSSEIEDFPMKVSKSHFPDVEQLGDVTKINGGKVPPVDIICAGSPCQDLSVGGNQKGLAGSRSNLFFESVRIVREMRKATNGIYPKFFVWENVTGAFSSNHGRDFQAVLGEITQTDIPMPGSGRWSKAGMVRGKRVGCAWRVLDAQYWGVPQHRERIFLVAGFGKWGGAVEVLFKPESVRRDPPESEGEGQDNSTGTVPGASGTGRGVCQHGDAAFVGNLQVNSTKVKNTAGVWIGKALATNMSAKGNAWWRSMKDETFYIGKIPGLHSQMPMRIISERADTLRASGIGGVAVKEDEPMKIYECHAQDSRYNERTVSPTLGRKMGTSSGNIPLKVEKDDCDHKTPQAVLKPSGYVVRRLTPLECERLQGLPDNYTAYGSDTARYKAIGNGMAQPCADFVLSKVVEMFEKADDET